MFWIVRQFLRQLETDISRRGAPIATSKAAIVSRPSRKSFRPDSIRSAPGKASFIRLVYFESGAVTCAGAPATCEGINFCASTMNGCG